MKVFKLKFAKENFSDRIVRKQLSRVNLQRRLNSPGKFPGGNFLGGGEDFGWEQLLWRIYFLGKGEIFHGEGGGSHGIS